MAMKQRGLGRGLGALLTDYSENDAAQAITTLPLQRIEPNPNQPRKRFDEVELQALADSIAQHGLLQPLAVRDMGNGYYQIIAGERRWRACRLAGLSADYRVYPGHDMDTTLAKEKRYNPYLQ